jgi:hypothetical protein
MDLGRHIGRTLAAQGIEIAHLKMTLARAEDAPGVAVLNLLGAGSEPELRCALQLELDGEILERLARAAHAVFCAEQTALGWKPGPRRNEATRENSSLVEFDLLPGDEKEQNRSQVRDIPAKLAHAGCYMVPARSGEPPFVFPDDVFEELASMEHTRWMRDKARDDWRHGSPTDKARKLHQCMLPWSLNDLTPYAGFAERLGAEELPEVEKEKDRTVVRKIATILAHAGYTIAEARGKGQRATAAAPK